MNKEKQKAKKSSDKQRSISLSGQISFTQFSTFKVIFYIKLLQNVFCMDIYSEAIVVEL